MLLEQLDLAVDDRRSNSARYDQLVARSTQQCSVAHHKTRNAISSRRVTRDRARRSRWSPPHVRRSFTTGPLTTGASAPMCGSGFHMGPRTLQSQLKGSFRESFSSPPRCPPVRQLIDDGIADVDGGGCLEPIVIGGCYPFQIVKHRHAVRHRWFTEHLDGMLQLVPE